MAHGKLNISIMKIKDELDILNHGGDENIIQVISIVTIYICFVLL